MSTTSTYTVNGMTCGHCVASVTEEVSKLDGVTAVDVDLSSGRVTVESDGPVDDAAFAAAVDEARYTVSTCVPASSSAPPACSTQPRPGAERPWAPPPARWALAAAGPTK